MHPKSTETLEEQKKKSLEMFRLQHHAAEYVESQSNKERGMMGLGYD